MIRALRLRHAVAWSVLAAALPLSIVAGRAVTPQGVVSDLPRRAVPAPLDRTVASIEREDARFTLRADGEGGALQLEVVVKRPLAAAAAALHLDDASGGPGPLIGVLGPRGLYRFALPAVPRAILLRDPARDRILDELRFEGVAP